MTTSPTMDTDPRPLLRRRRLPHRHGQQRRGVGRWLAPLGIALVLLLALGYVGIGWYVSGEIIDGLRVEAPQPIQYDTQVLALADGEITLERPDEPALAADRDAVMGLSWDGGYGQIGPSLSFEGGTEVREFVLLEGAPPAIGENPVDVDSFAFPTDPTTLWPAVQTVTYPSPLGELEAWLFPGEGSTWIIGVHGAGADRHELLRLVDATADLGYPILLVRYRNDPGAPRTNGSLILAGQQEWEDVAAAIDYALVNGASDVVLAGASMGGGLTLGYLMEGDVEVVRGAVLEAPNADLREIVRLRSGEALPVGGPLGASFLAAGRAFAWLRTGLDFDAIDYVGRANALTTPILLFHGTDDTTIPMEIGQALAEARPDLVEFHPIEGGFHVRAWNEDPVQYRATLGRFLGQLGRSD
jgi:uncharacterized protein